MEKIDKEKLLAIARKNALKLIDAGVVPGAEKLTAIKAGGKTVNELTGQYLKLHSIYSESLNLYHGNNFDAIFFFVRIL